jgi:hypothetical protein
VPDRIHFRLNIDFARGRKNAPGGIFRVAAERGKFCREAAILAGRGRQLLPLFIKARPDKSRKAWENLIQTDTEKSRQV